MAHTEQLLCYPGIAFQNSRLLRADEIIGPSDLLAHTHSKEQQLRAFWACWLTKCASQQNARFESDSCWQPVARRFLPDDSGPLDISSPRLYLNDEGLLVRELDVLGTNQERSGFYARMILIFGIWFVPYKSLCVTNYTFLCASLHLD